MSTCIETFSTLRIFSENLSPEQIGATLGFRATTERPRDLTSKYKSTREINYWAWCSRDSVTGTDGVPHIKAIVDMVMPRQESLKALQSQGCKTDIVNYWVSTGQGGPELPVDLMHALVQLELPIWWDVYFDGKSRPAPVDSSVA